MRLKLGRDEIATIGYVHMSAHKVWALFEVVLGHVNFFFLFEHHLVPIGLAKV